MATKLPEEGSRESKEMRPEFLRLISAIQELPITPVQKPLADEAIMRIENLIRRTNTGEYRMIDGKNYFRVVLFSGQDAPSDSELAKSTEPSGVRNLDDVKMDGYMTRLLRLLGAFESLKVEPKITPVEYTMASDLLGILKSRSQGGFVDSETTPLYPYDPQRNEVSEVPVKNNFGIEYVDFSGTNYNLQRDERNLAVVGYIKV